MNSGFNEESVEYKILIDALDAQKNLQELAAQATGFDEKVTTIISGLKNFSLQSGMSIKNVSNYFRELEKRAMEARDVIKMFNEQGMTNFITPELTKLSQAQPMFSTMNPQLWKEVNTQIAITEKELSNAAKVAQKLADSEAQVAAEAQAAAKAASNMPANFMGKTFGSVEQAQQVVNTLKQINNLDFMNPATYQGNVKSLMGIINNLATQTGSSFREVGNEISKSFSNVPNITMATKDAVGKLEKGLEGATNKAGGFKRSIDVLRIALGTLIAMAVFQFFNFITESIRKTIDGVKQLELALYQVGNAERALSEAGVSITPKDFDAMIKSLKELFPYLSKVDLTRMISQIALLTKDLGLTKDQLEGLVQAIPVMAQRGQVTIEQATQQVVNGLANNGRGWKDLGIVVDAAIIKQEAVNAKIVESADAYDKLTAEQQKQVDVLALLSILNKSVTGEQKNQTEYQKTLDATTKELAATWEDFLAKLGKFAAPVLISYLKIIINFLETWLKILEEFTPAIATFTALWSAAINTIVYQLLSFNTNIKNTAKVFKDSFKEAYESVIKSLSDITDTATLPEIKVPVEADTTKVKKELEDLDKDLLKMKEQEDKLNKEFATKQSRELQDHTTDMARDEQDYQIKRSRFIQDANQEINRKNKEYHQSSKYFKTVSLSPFVQEIFEFSLTTILEASALLILILPISLPPTVVPTSNVIPDSMLV